MKVNISLLLLVGLTLLSMDSIFAQEIDEPVEIVGQILESEERESMPGANIINLNSVTGATTDDQGKFSIRAIENDTLMISFIGYQTIKLRITQDLLKGNELEVILYEKLETLNTATVNNTSLIGVLEIDIKQIPKDEYNRIQINGLPQLYEIGAPQASKFTSPIAAIFQPVDFMYNQFGKKPKQLKKLKQLRSEDEMRDILSGRFDREWLLEYLEMDSRQLDKLLDDCKYSDYFIREASDLQLLEALLECYENYKAVKTGSIERNTIPENN